MYEGDAKTSDQGPVFNTIDRINRKLDSLGAKLQPIQSQSPSVAGATPQNAPVSVLCDKLNSIEDRITYLLDSIVL